MGPKPAASERYEVVGEVATLVARSFKFPLALRIAITLLCGLMLVSCIMGIVTSGWWDRIIDVATGTVVTLFASWGWRAAVFVDGQRVRVRNTFSSYVFELSDVVRLEPRRYGSIVTLRDGSSRRMEAVCIGAGGSLDEFLAATGLKGSTAPDQWSGI